MISGHKFMDFVHCFQISGSQWPPTEMTGLQLSFI